MVRTLNRLTASQVKAAAPGKYADGGGLWLHKRDDGGGQWFLRVTVHGRRREMGLGSITEVSLKEAREVADKQRSLVRQGFDPIRLRQRQRREAIRNVHSLRDIALDAFESRKAELKDDGKAGRWWSPLELHVLPKLGGVPVAEITQIDIRDVLRPIWHEKADTACKALNRLSICLKHAAALGLDVDLQAPIKAQALLGKRDHTATHIPAFRSSFRDWIAEATNTPFEVAETCLQHAVGGTVERAYRRSDFLEQRRGVMDQWAGFVTGPMAALPTEKKIGREDAPQ